MRITHNGYILSGLTAVMLAAGCASTGIKHAYEGQARNPSELAAVWGSTDAEGKVLTGPRQRISITAVDDKRTLPWLTLEAYPTAVYVLPGKHKLDVQYEHVHGVANGPIWVDAAAKRSYQIKVMNPQARTERVYFVIEDVTAQTLVGGVAEKAEEAEE